MKAVTAEMLSKQYAEGKVALSTLSLSLDQGEVFGFLGPNGAGKTTTVKLLGGMLTPTGGTCRVFDIDPAARPEQVHAFSGVITEHAQMYDHLTGLDNLLFYGKVFGVTGTQAAERAQHLLERMALTDAAGRKLGTYSTGMRQRLSLARAMLHRPKILFLDEPTSGLDPESAQDVNNMIKDMAKSEGTTVFLCTHQLRYAQEICSSYGLIDDGVLLATGTLQALRGMVASGTTIRIHADSLPQGLPPYRMAGQYAEFTVGAEAEIPAIVRQIVQAGGSIYHVSTHALSLEEIYFALLEQRKGSKEAAND